MNRLSDVEAARLGAAAMRRFQRREPGWAILLPGHQHPPSPTCRIWFTFATRDEAEAWAAWNYRGGNATVQQDPTGAFGTRGQAAPTPDGTVVTCGRDDCDASATHRRVLGEAEAAFEAAGWSWSLAAGWRCRDHGEAT